MCLFLRRWQTVFGISGPVETTAIEAAQKQFNVCLFGAVRVLKPALPALRNRKGMILFTSSVAAMTPIPYQAFYSAAKAAINSLVMTLQNELKVNANPDSPLQIIICKGNCYFQKLIFQGKILFRLETYAL